MPPDDTLAPLYRSWLNSAMPKRQGPELGKVQSSTCSAQEYTCAVKLLEPDSLAETGTELSGVSINPLWADSHGSGIYVPPENGQIVVIGYLGMDRSHPFVSAIWGGQTPNLRPSCPAAAPLPKFRDLSLFFVPFRGPPLKVSGRVTTKNTKKVRNNTKNSKTPRLLPGRPSWLPSPFLTVFLPSTAPVAHSAPFSAFPWRPQIPRLDFVPFRPISCPFVVPLSPPFVQFVVPIVPPTAPPV